MEKSRKVLILSLMFLGAMAVLLSGLYVKLQLKSPMVFEQYTEMPLFPEENGAKGDFFVLDLLQNRNDPRTLLHLSFPEEDKVEARLLTSGNFSFWISNGQDDERTGIGPYRKTSYDFDLYMESMPEKDILLTKVRLHFSDGTDLEKELGKVVLFATDRNLEYPVGIFSSSSSSDRLEIKDGRASRDLQVLGAVSPLLEDVRENFRLTVNGVEMEQRMNLRVRSGELLTFRAEWKGKVASESYNVYRFSPQFRYKDLSMEEKSFRVEMINERLLNIDTIGLIRYLIERGEI